MVSLSFWFHFPPRPYPVTTNLIRFHSIIFNLPASNFTPILGQFLFPTPNSLAVRHPLLHTYTYAYCMLKTDMTAEKHKLGWRCVPTCCSSLLTLSVPALRQSPTKEMAPTRCIHRYIYTASHQLHHLLQLEVGGVVRERKETDKQ